MLCICNKRSIAITLQVLLVSFIALNGELLRAQSRIIFSDSINTLKSHEIYFDGNEKLVTLNNSHIATIYNKWAKNEADRGNYQFASDLYEEALKLNPLNDNSEFLLNINFVELYLRRGMYSHAKLLLDELVPITKKQCFAYYSNLSSYYLYLNRLDSAKITLQYLDKLAESTEEKSNVASDMSYLYMQLGDYSSAYDIISQELNQEENKKRRYILLSHKAIIESQLNLNDRAIEDIDSCLHWQKIYLGEEHQDYIISLRKKGEILQRMGKLKDAAIVYKQYIELERKYAISVFSTFSEQQRLDYWKNKKPLLSEPFALEYSQDKSYSQFLFELALFRRQVALLGNNDNLMINQKLSYSANHITKSLGKKDIAIEFIKYEKEKKNKYAALLIAGSDKKHVKFIHLWSEDSIKSFNVGGKRLDSALCSKQSKDKNLVYQNEALSSYVWDKLLQFIPEGSSVYFAPDGLLHLLAIEYLPSVNNPKYDLHRLTSTALLSEKKKKPTKSQSKSLVIGGMDYDFIPQRDHNAIVTNHDAYNYSLQNKRLLHFSYLPGSKTEADSIAMYLNKTDQYEDIDEGDLKLLLGNYNIVHLATHGYSWHVDVPSVPYAYRDSITEDQSLLASGIAISGANWLYIYPNRDDGLLSARELCEMDLSNVELVVASSCQSAQGRVSDEGPVGLVRGLKKAGVRTIMASLWPVNDNATMLLMQFFYDEWREGRGKDNKGCSKTDALRLAQYRLREAEGIPKIIRTYNASKKTGDYETIISDFDAPYYWAPFIIIDDL